MGSAAFLGASFLQFEVSCALPGCSVVFGANFKYKIVHSRIRSKICQSHQKNPSKDTGRDRLRNCSIDLPKNFGKRARNFFSQISQRVARGSKIKNNRGFCWQGANRIFNYILSCFGKMHELSKNGKIKKRVSKMFSLQFSLLLQQTLSKSRLAKTQNNL